MESLGNGVSDAKFEARTLRGRRLDKAKVKRWRKREQVQMAGCPSSSEMQLGNQDESMEEVPGHAEQLRSMAMEQETLDVDRSWLLASSEMEICNEEETQEEKPRQERQIGSVPIHQGPPFNPWLSVDVINSPRLTGLIGALTLELCQPISGLDLSAPYSEDWEDLYGLMSQDEDRDSTISKEVQKQQKPRRTAESVSFSIRALSIYFSKQRQTRLASPSNELYPFPTSAQPRGLFQYAQSDRLVSEYSLKMMEFECRAKFKAWKTMEQSEVIDLLENMRNVALRHEQLDHLHLSESWWRRVVTCSLGTQRDQPFRVLYAYSYLVKCIALQGRLEEARNLHQCIHQKIIEHFEPEHELALCSKYMLADLRTQNGEFSSAIAVYRELLQLFLLRFGVRHAHTLLLFLRLGNAMNAYGQYNEAESILSIRLELDCEVSSYAEENSIDALHTLKTISTLAWSLREQRKYEDSAKVLEVAEQCLKDSLRIESTHCWDYYDEKARVLAVNGQVLESEKLLRAIQSYAYDYPDQHTMNSMIQLAGLLEETGRGSEAVILREKVFLMRIEMHGIEHKFSREDCEELGFCYADLGQYDKAVHHFQQIIERLALCQSGDPDFRAEYVAQIHDWICDVEEMREEASTLEIQRNLERVS